VRVVLVWCNPIQDGRRRDLLDAMLRRLAAFGITVSAHPEAIHALGTKDVLLAARDLPFGSDVHRIDSLAQLQSELPRRLRGGARVLKQHRGNGGNGVWRVEQAEDASKLRVRHAQRGSEEEWMDMPTLAQRMAPYFERANGGHMIDQAWQPRIAEGMVRAYMSGDRVAGFGHQLVRALADPRDGPAPPRLYSGPQDPRFQRLRALMERDWAPGLCRTLSIAPDDLPVIWDADVLLGPKTPGGEDSYVLCEINASSVFPIPDEAPDALAGVTLDRLVRTRRRPSLA